MKSYIVNRIPLDELKITGKGDDKLWSKAIDLIDFCSPWEDLTKTETKFKALWDGNYLFFCFDVMDNTVHINKTDNSIKSINVSDRVELFFRSNSSLNPYYCLEIDPTPRIMDFKAYPNNDFDFNWNWPKEDLVIKSSLNKEGFCVEGKISVESLKDLNLLNNDRIETGIYRAKYNKVRNEFVPIWLTWVNPKISMPNFHIASSFGVLRLC